MDAGWHAIRKLHASGEAAPIASALRPLLFREARSISTQLADQLVQDTCKPLSEALAKGGIDAPKAYCKAALLKRFNTLARKAARRRTLYPPIVDGRRRYDPWERVENSARVLVPRLGELPPAYTAYAAQRLAVLKHFCHPLSKTLGHALSMPFVDALEELGSIARLPTAPEQEAGLQRLLGHGPGQRWDRFVLRVRDRLVEVLDEE
ncbi:MAG TPA: hypothetical protein QGF58_14520 [Myxococcota bacterium]|nr:hypothetical protein [Myxococcota bacterium]